MSHFGKNSMMCPHGDEDGKCDQCYDIWAATGVTPTPLGTFGEMEKKRNAEQNPEPEKVSVVEQVRREVVAEFMARSEERHRYD